jgi:hypothetical protein
VEYPTRFGELVSAEAFYDPGSRSRLLASEAATELRPAETFEALDPLRNEAARNQRLNETPLRSSREAAFLAGVEDGILIEKDRTATGRAISIDARGHFGRPVTPTPDAA